MVETEWLACAVPDPMLQFLRGRTTDRKLRCFAFACVRRIWHLVPTEPLRRAVEVSERHADGLADRRDLGSAVADAHRARPRQSDAARAAYHAARYDAGAVDWWGVVHHAARAAASAAVVDVPPTAISYWDGGRMVTLDVPPSVQRLAYEAKRAAEYLAQCGLVRDIFANRFRPAAVDPAHVTETVSGLARAIYVGRAFERMPELAAALEGAGCSDTIVLNHCRGRDPHVRGCRVVDRLLGQE